MESKVKLFGHPVHPMLIVFPAGSFTGAVIFDILYLIFRNPLFPAVSFYIIVLGVIGGLLAAVFGFIDWGALPSNSRARSIGLWHGLGNFVIVVLFAVSWLLRRGNADFVPGGFALILSFAGIVLALITLWIGGELVYRLGVGVDRGANVDAPSSLSQSSASSSTERTMNRTNR
jgi:uncharacterized membrane protein